MGTPSRASATVIAADGFPASPALADVIDAIRAIPSRASSPIFDRDRWRAYREAQDTRRTLFQAKLDAVKPLLTAGAYLTAETMAERCDWHGSAAEIIAAAVKEDADRAAAVRARIGNDLAGAAWETLGGEVEAARAELRSGE